MNDRAFHIVAFLGILWVTYLTFSPFVSFNQDWTLALVITPWVQLCIVVTGLGVIISYLKNREY